jgi:threonine aldolase
MQAANPGDAGGYGHDDFTRGVEAKLCAATGASQAYFVFNGTAANLLGLSLLLRPYEAVICAESSHLNVDECGAAERLLGSKLLAVPTPDGKLTPELIGTRLGGRGDEHRAQPRLVEIAQVTETGTCYTLAELAELREFCGQHGLLLYLDGARIANAAAHLNCSLADIAALADVLSFGGTKNGALGVEAVLVMNDKLAAGAEYHRKQLLQLASKMRFLAAQVDALLTDDVWLANARHSNRMADRLASGVESLPGVRMAYPVQSNGVFAELDRQQALRLQQGWTFYLWSETGDRAVARWMTAFDTTEADVDELIAAVKETSVSRET